MTLTLLIANHKTLHLRFESLRNATATGHDHLGLSHISARLVLFFVLLGTPHVARGQVAAEFRPPSDIKHLREVDIEPTDLGSRDMGILPIRQPVVFGIPLRNSTKTDKKLVDVNVSCGCMVAAPSSTTFKSGDVTVVYLRVLPKEEGALRKQVRFTFEENHELVVNVEAIVRPLHTVPAFLDMDGASDAAQITVTRNFEIGAADISDVHVSGEGVTVQALHYEAQPSTERKLTLNLTAFVESSNLRQPIEICVVNPEGKQHLYRCLLRRTDLVRVHPSMLVERANKPGEASVTAYLEGDLEVLKRLSGRNGLACHALDHGASARIVSTRQMGDSMIAVVIVINERPQDARSIEIEWIDKSTNKVIGRNSVLLSQT
jgi:hypothetical protein